MSAATGYYRPGTTWLHRRNPVTKILALGWVLLSAFLLPPISLVVLGVLVGVVAATTGLTGALVRSLRIPAALIVSIVAINALFYPGARDIVGALGPFAVTREGLTFGVISAGRLLVAFAASILFLFSTLADDLLEALVARGASHRIAFVILSAVQMVPRLQSRASSILEAQQARGLQIAGSLRQRIRALLPLVGPILLGSLIDVRERTFALEARAFGAHGGRTAYRVVADPPADRWLRLGLLAASVGVVAAVVSGTLR